MSDPVPLDDRDCLETGFAVVHRTDDHVYKRRKPIRLRVDGQVVDLTSAEARRAACREEARLDEILTPELEPRVVPVRKGDDGRLRADDDDANDDDDEPDRGGEPAMAAAFDWALRLRRLRDEDRADRRLERGALDEPALRAVAERLATFHERARGSVPHANERVLEALRARIDLQLEVDGAPVPPLPETAEQAARWQRDFVEAEAERLIARADGDAIRRGHGELALDHVFVDRSGEVRIVAGLEIAPELRHADVAADVALLAADLAVRHRSDLAERFVAEYARLANDFDLYPLLDFYTSLRASQRARIDWLAATQSTPDGSEAARYRERARRFLALAVAAPRRSLLPPIVVAMGGQVASGKSTVALEIARRIGAPVVGSDPTRDYLLGARLNEHLHETRWEENFEPGFGERVYDEVFRRAGAVLASGRPVVVDGCFRTDAQRLRARALAEQAGLPFLFVEARVSREVQRGRLAERAERDGVPIDDWQAIADDLRADWEPVSALGDDEHLALDTGRPIETNADAIEAALPTWPERLTG